MAFSKLTTVAHINEIRDPVAHKTTKNVLIRNSIQPPKPKLYYGAGGQLSMKKSRSRLCCYYGAGGQPAIRQTKGKDVALLKRCVTLWPII